MNTNEIYDAIAAAERRKAEVEADRASDSSCVTRAAACSLMRLSDAVQAVALSINCGHRS